MVKRRNRKIETVIDATLSNATTGVQYYGTTLSNSLGYLDGFASSIWPMGTNVSFHNTGTSEGGDFGELNKLNYDNLIELYTPDSRIIGMTGSYLSMTNQTGTISSSGGPYVLISLKDTDSGCGQIIEFSGTFTGSFSGTVGGAWDTSSVLPANTPGFFEWRVSSSVENDPNVFWSIWAGIVPIDTEYGVRILDTLVPFDSTFRHGTGSGPVGTERGQDFIECGIGGWENQLPATNHLVHLQLGDYAWYNDPATNLSIQDKQYNVYSTQSFLGLCDLAGSGFYSNTRWYNSPENTLLENPNEYTWRIERKFRATPISDSGGNSTNWYFDFQFTKDSAEEGEIGYCWHTFYSWPPVNANNVTPAWLGGTLVSSPNGTGTKISQSLYFAADAWMFDPASGNNQTACSIVSASVVAFETRSFTRSNYSKFPTASISYCYPAGFITNDSFSSSYTGLECFPPLWPLTTCVLTESVKSYREYNYKDYGLMWNVSNERERLLGEKRYPFFNSYEEFAVDIRAMGKEYSILPEFRISDLIETTTGQPQSLLQNFDFLSLAGANITSSQALGNAPTAMNLEFFKEYSDTDFQSDLDLMSQQHLDLPGAAASNLGLIHELTVSCEAILKLLPYEGFYPITRTTQLAAIFSQSIDVLDGNDRNIELIKFNNETGCWDLQESADYDASPNLHGIRTQGIMQPWFAPGILYNSIKSGIGVGWTIATSSVLQDVYQMYNTADTASWTTGTILANEFLNSVVYHKPEFATKIPFETLWKPAEIGSGRKSTPNNDVPSTDGAWHINYPETLSGYFTSSVCSSSLDRYTISQNNNFMIRDLGIWNRLAYQKAMNNFMAETVRFFLRDRRGVSPSTTPDAVGQLTDFHSLTPAEILQRGTTGPISGATYYMDVVLAKDTGYVMCESAFPAGTSRYFNRHTAMWDIESPGAPQPFQTSAGDFAGQNFSQDELAVGDAAIFNFSASFNGRYFGPATPKYVAHWNYRNPVSGAHYNVCDPAQAPYTPPYYYGESINTIVYHCDKEWQGSGLLDWNDVFRQLEHSVSNPGLETMIDEGNFNSIVSGQNRASTGSFAYTMAQNVQDSIDLEGVRNVLQTTVPGNETGRFPNQSVGGSEYTNNFQNNSSRWVISTKWECPILDFREQTSETLAIPGGLHPTCSFSASDGFLNNTPIGLGRGMWSGYGLVGSEDSGVKLELRQTAGWRTNAKVPRGTRVGETYNNSLLDLMGFADGSPDQTSVGTYLGRLAPTRIMREAVVMIPYTTVVRGPPSSTQPYAETTSGDPSTDRYAVAVPGKRFFKIHPNLVWETTSGGPGRPKFQGEEDPASPGTFIRTEITEMLGRMVDYIVPPQFDFLRGRVATQQNFPPIVMYILPFERLLDQRDLQDIWQGVLPEPGITAKIESSQIAHELGRMHFFGDYAGTVDAEHLGVAKIPPDVRFMVFKIKWRGEQNYSSVTRTNKDDVGIGTNIELQSSFDVINALQGEYGYNWPYDFYSLVELGKLKTSFKIK